VAITQTRRTDSNMIDIKIEGLEQTDELQKFITQTDEDISNFSFDKADPSSINAAIQKMESEIVTRHPIIIMMPQLLS
jgi:hypothetical protein